MDVFALRRADRPSAQIGIRRRKSVKILFCEEGTYPLVDVKPDNGMLEGFGNYWGVGSPKAYT